MFDFAQLLAEPADQVTLWIEHADGSRQKMGDAVDLAEGKTKLETCAKAWMRQGPGRTVENTDDVTWRLVQHLKSVGLLYVDPLPIRAVHDGDVRINRTLHPRYPRPGRTTR